MTQITLRNVPDEVRNKIKQLSRQRRQSMNTLAVSLLQDSLGLKSGMQSQRDLSGISGSMTEAEFREFERNTAVFFEQLDTGTWSVGA